MNRSTAGLPVHHQLLEFTQTHVHWVGDAVQPSHPLLSPSPPALNPSQHQGLFNWVSSSHQVAKVLELQLQHQSFQWFQDWFPLGLIGLIFLQYKGRSRVFSNTTVQKHQFFGAQLSLRSSQTHTWLLEKSIALTIWTFVGKVMLFNTLSRFVMTFLPRRKCLLFSWLQLPSTVILETKKRKSVTPSTFPSSIYCEVLGPEALILVFWILSFKPTNIG